MNHTNRFHRLFAQNNENYAKFRPHYPSELYERILEYHSGDNQLVVDVATGTGQATAQLSTAFQNVIALDCSPEQLSHAAGVANVAFKVATAENFMEEASLKESSVDLITVASALHWFDLEKFHNQCRRALKPDGCLAAWSYGLWSYPDNPAATAAVKELYEALRDYWPSPIQHIRERYQKLFPSKEAFAESEFFSVRARARMDLRHAVGYMSTWSFYRAYIEANGTKDDPMVTFQEKTMAALGLKGPEDEFEVEWEFFGILARNPRVISNQCQMD